MKNNQGYTVVELLVGLVFVASLALGGLLVWAAIHFIQKWW